MDGAVQKHRKFIMYNGCLKSSLILSQDFVEEAPGQGSALSVQGQ